MFVHRLNIFHEVYSGLPVKIFYVFMAFLMRVSCPAHSCGFDHHNSVKFTNYEYPPLSCCFLSPRFNKSPQHYCQTPAVPVFLLSVQSPGCTSMMMILRKYSTYSFSLKCFCSHYICYDGTLQITVTLLMHGF